jgi:divalent metal cation (Fe/Co/Zn/Cd) transporter
MARSATSSRSVVYVALTGNILVAISKFVAAAWTGSSAMLSEGVHSVVDSVNELLLLYGLHKSASRPDRDHPLGYGREIYFLTALLVARETKGLLIGEATNRRTHDSIMILAKEMDGVSSANGVLTAQLAPKEIVVALSVEFSDSLRAPDIEAAVVEFESRIRAHHPDVIGLFVKPQTHERFIESASRHYGAPKPKSQK